MTYASHQNDFADCVAITPAARPAAVKRAGSFLRHIFDSVFEWGDNGAAADAEAAGFLERSGGRLTDDIEREMMRRRTTSNWTVHG